MMKYIRNDNSNLEWLKFREQSKRNRLRTPTAPRASGTYSTKCLKFEAFLSPMSPVKIVLWKQNKKTSYSLTYLTH